jgi:hypothetical protein
MMSPANILRQILVDAGLVTMPGVPQQTVPFQQAPGDGSTLCYTSSLPDDEDQAVLIKGTAGKVFGRQMRGGKTDVHHGVKFNIRSPNDEIGSLLAIALADGVDKIPPLLTVVLNEVSHYVQSVYRTSSVMEMGEERGKKRQLWSFNVRIAMQNREPTIG